MNFVRYDTDTGEILQMGWMSPEFVLQEIADGMPTLINEDHLEWGRWRVNPETKLFEEIVPVPTENTSNTNQIIQEGG